MIRGCIGRRFEGAGSAGRAAFIPFLTGGYPDMDMFAELLQVVSSSGADIIEVGIPFSDPIADGPVIQASSCIALERGATVDTVMETVARVAPGLGCPLVAMSYLNPVMAAGCGRFAAMARDSGISAVIVPDLPPEESGVWLPSAHAAGLDTVFLAAPTTPDRRLERILAVCTGYLYYVCVTGVTGSGLPGDMLVLAERLARIRSRSPVPVAAGFGISEPGEAAQLSAACDGIIVGTAITRTIMEAGDAGRSPCGDVGELCSRMRRALDRAGKEPAGHTLRRDREEVGA